MDNVLHSKAHFLPGGVQGAVIRKREHFAVEDAVGDCCYVTRQGNLCQMEHMEGQTFHQKMFRVRGKQSDVAPRKFAI
jgi:hypothetical protein